MTDSDDLANQECIPCKGGVPPLTSAEQTVLLERIGQGWEAVDGHHLSRTFKFRNFAGALEFVNRVGAVAEAQNHHPDLYLAWGKARVDIWTHKIDGLTESDFVFAAKVDRLAPRTA